METIDLRNVVKKIKATVVSHELPIKGQYARWLWQDKKGSRNLGVSEYGCADAANILYTINDFYCDDETRAARIRELQALQNKETGMFSEPTHHTIHTTAHCSAALQLFDAKPLYPINGLKKYFDKEELYKLLDGLNWVGNPWTDSHQGAGVYAALVNADEVTPEFQKNYFDWMWENADPEYGFWKKGYIENAPFSGKWDRRPGETIQAPMYVYMAGGFHYMFNHEYAKMPLRYPEKVIDTCIKMYKENALPPEFFRSVTFIQIDWIFCLSRACRQTTYRNEEARTLLWDCAEKLLSYFDSVDGEKDEQWNDLHCLFGGVCAMAELQTIFPGKIITDKPLRLVLDRRPFI